LGQTTGKGAAAVIGVLLATGVTAAPASGASLTSSTPLSITTIAGNGTAGASGDGGPAVNAQLHSPNGVALDGLGNLYISDGANNRIRKVMNPTAVNADTIATAAGTGQAGFRGDGGPAVAAELNRPSGIAIDAAGDLFVADAENNRVREVLASGIILTFAGNGSCGRKIPIGDGLPAVKASLCHPMGVAVDGRDVYISDTGHDEVRVVNAGGIIDGFLGHGKFAHGGDRRAELSNSAQIKLELPTGLAVDALGDVFITDTGASKVLEVLADGTVRTLAGTGKPGYSGDGGMATGARLNRPTGVGVGQTGDVYIADTRNNRLRQVTSNGVISTVAGTGRFGFSGDGGSATKARLAFPIGSIAASGTNIYFSDTANQRVRGLFSGPPPVLPETQWAIALPLATFALGAGAYVLVRRRRRAGLSTG
jgi:hypothetical protein